MNKKINKFNLYITCNLAFKEFGGHIYVPEYEYFSLYYLYNNICYYFILFYFILFI